MWLNVDIPTKQLTLHNDTCIYIPKEDSKYKMIDSFGPDGGWINFKNEAETLLYCENNYSNFSRKFCNRCK